jgi:ADP-ribose pyrophosphatase YjhB (NUDIX family)
MAISPHVVWLRSKVGSAMLLLPSITVLVENDHGEILVVRNTGIDVWSTLGGMVEPQEHPATAAVREVKEEVGLDVELTELVMAAGGPECVVEYPNGDLVSYVTTVYRARPVPGQDPAAATADQVELQDVRWVAPDGFDSIEFDRFANYLFTELGYLNRR